MLIKLIGGPKHGKKWKADVIMDRIAIATRKPFQIGVEINRNGNTIDYFDSLLNSIFYVRTPFSLNGMQIFLVSTMICQESKTIKNIIKKQIEEEDKHFKQKRRV